MIVPVTLWIMYGFLPLGVAPWYFSLVSFVAVAGCGLCGLGGSCPWLLAMVVALGHGSWLLALGRGSWPCKVRSSSSRKEFVAASGSSCGCASDPIICLRSQQSYVRFSFSVMLLIQLEFCGL